MNIKEHEFYKHPLTLKGLEFKKSITEGEKILIGEFFDPESHDHFQIDGGIPDFTYPKELEEVDEETRETYEKLTEEYDKFADIPFKTFKTSEAEVRTKLTEKLQIKEIAKKKYIELI